MKGSAKSSGLLRRLDCFRLRRGAADQALSGPLRAHDRRYLSMRDNGVTGSQSERREEGEQENSERAEPVILRQSRTWGLRQPSPHFTYRPPSTISTEPVT